MFNVAVMSSPASKEAICELIQSSSSMASGGSVDLIAFSSEEGGDTRLGDSVPEVSSS